MTTQEVQDQIIKEFGGRKNWMDKYAYLIKLGQSLPAIAPELKTENTLIKGCQVRTWYCSECKDGAVSFNIESLSSIIKGAVVLMLRVLNGRTPEEIKNTKLYFIDKLGLGELFLPSQANSLWKMRTLIEEEALSYSNNIK